MLDREERIWKREFSTIEEFLQEWVGDGDIRDAARQNIEIRFRDHILRKAYTVIFCRLHKKLYPENKHKTLADMLNKDRTTYGRYCDETQSVAPPWSILEEWLCEYGPQFDENDLRFPPEEEIERFAATRTISYILRDVLGDTRNVGEFGREEYEFLSLMFEHRELRSGIHAKSLSELNEVFRWLRSEVDKTPWGKTGRVVTCGQLAHIWEVWRRPFLLGLDAILHVLASPACPKDLLPGSD